MDSTDSSTTGSYSPPSTTSRSSPTELLELIDWAALPAAIRQTIMTLGPLMQEDCSQKEMARRLRLPEAKVAAMRRDLQDAILAQCRARLGDLEPRVRGLVDALASAA